MLDRTQQIKIIETAIFAAGEPVHVERLGLLFEEHERPNVKEIKEMLAEIAAVYQERGVELVEVASGYRFQAKSEFAPWLQRLWEKKPPRYSRPLLETLALILYRQPITRGEIEDIRGVVVSPTMLKTLLDHHWVKIVGYKDVPGKPALYGSTKQFLDYFNLKSLADLPALPDVTNLDALEQKLETQLHLNIDQPLAALPLDHVVTPADDAAENTHLFEAQYEALVDAEPTPTRSENELIEALDELI